MLKLRKRTKEREGKSRMGRNYIKEAAWKKQKYCRVVIDVEKELGEKFKEKAKNENKTISEILKEFMKIYIND